MAYTKHHAIQTCLTVLAILGIAFAFFSVSGRYDPEIIQGFEAPTVSLLASQESPLVIPLPHGEKEIAGVVLYAADNVTAHAVLAAKIQDVHGKTLVTKKHQNTKYKQSGAPEMQVFFSLKSYPKKEKIFLSIAPRNHEALSFIANQGDKKSSLVFSVLYREPTSSGAKQGVVIGTALALSFILLYHLRNTRKQQWLGAAAIIVLFSCLATLPYVYRPSDWGIHDWDYRYSLSHIYQTTIRTYHQFPMWNPYICGGTAGLGDPEFALFTPSFLLQFIFGVENGTGMALSLSFILTGLGMLLLAKSLKLGPFPSLIAAITVIFSSALMLKATEGHTTIVFAYMWVPWVLWAWLSAYRTMSAKWIVLCAGFLSLSLLQGGIYILSYTAMSIIALSLMSSRKKDALRISAYAGLWTMGFTSFQLIPTLFFLKEFPDQTFVGSAYTYANLWDIFFGRYLQNVYVIKDQVSRWHEYGAYIGYGVFALLLMGVSYFKSLKIVRVLLVGLLATLVISSLGPLFEPILQYLPFIPRSNISRLVLFTVLCCGLLAGFGMKRILAISHTRYPLFPLILAGFIAIDLLSMDYPIAEQGFVVPRVNESIPQSSMPLEYTDNAYQVRYQGNDIPRSYAAARKGYGTFSFCSVIGPQSSVIATSPAHAYLWSEEDVKTRLLSWSPNKVVFAYEASHDTEIIMNSNYANGWHVDKGSIVRTSPSVTIHVPAGDDIVTVQYRSPGMILGVCSTLGTLLFLYIKRKNMLYTR